MYEHDGSFKYTTGNKETMVEALTLKEELKKNGYDDIFIVAFLNEQRIEISKAKELSEKYN